MSRSSSPISICSSTNVFTDGKYTSETLPPVKPDKTLPKPLSIITPVDAGEFPVLILLHGYLLLNSFYSQLAHHIASHGYIVVVPQLYTVAGCDATNDVKNVARITNWLPEGLTKVLPPQVNPDLTKLGLAGHSRGGKAAFALILNRVKTEVLKLKFSALIGINPVDGMGAGKQTPPEVLTYVPHSFNLGMPVMVIGASLGEVKGNLGFSCAPKGVNHEDFYEECCKPACYFVVKDYGHLDILDDKTAGIRGKASYCVCKNGETREPMRRFVGGIVVAFLKGYLEGDLSFLMAIKDGEIVPPVELQTVDFQL